MANKYPLILDGSQIRELPDSSGISIGSSSTITDTKVGQWETAYGWGNHASGGYAQADSVNASALVGTLDSARFPSVLPAVNGSLLTGLSAGGKVLQVVQSVDTTPTSVSLNAGQQWNNNLSVSITPSSTSNKILVFYTVHMGSTTRNIFSTLYRDGSAISGSEDSGAIGNANSVRQRVSCASDMGDTSYAMVSQSFTYLDSPSTTSAVTYSPKLSHGSGGTQTVYINRDQTYADGSGYATPVCQITAVEISG